MPLMIHPYRNEDPLELLRRCGGYYECPRDASGKRLGPLVGYAGKYDTPDGKKHYVGDVYANFAKAERHGQVLAHFAGAIAEKLPFSATGFIGAPEGGKALAATLAVMLGWQYIFPEKKITAVATSYAREESVMVFDRHEPEAKTYWYIGEDVINNMSTPDALDAILQSYGASIAGIVCFLNRSAYDNFYTLKSGQKVPIIEVVRKQIPQYRQDDPEVASDVAAHNVVWKPKIEWPRLERAMMRAVL